METKPKVHRNRKISDSYLNLVVEHPLISIKSQAQLESAQEMVDRLLMKGFA